MEMAYGNWLREQAREKRLVATAERVLEEKAKEKEMNVEQTVEQLIKAKQKEKEVARRLAWIEAAGEDSWEDGSIVRFVKKQELGTSVSTHVAIKKGKYWYVLSDTGLAQRKCWPDFLLWLSEDNPEPALYKQQDVGVNPLDVPTVEVTSDK